MIFPMATVAIHDEPLHSKLNDVVDLCRDSKNIDKRRLRDAGDVMQHVSTDRLLQVMSDGDKPRADDDASKCRIRLRDMRPELTEVARKAFTGIGLMDSGDRIYISGNGFYPKNSYMGWHTNSNSGGLRVYCNWARETGKSGLCYYHKGFDTVRQVSLDCAGWNFRVFRTDYRYPFWHAVFSKTSRISIGFRIR